MEINIDYLREVATRPASGLRIIEGAEWRVLHDDLEKGLLFVGHESKSGGVDYLAGAIREAEVAEFIATFNPRTVLALLDVVEKMTNHEHDLTGHANGWWECACGYRVNLGIKYVCRSCGYHPGNRAEWCAVGCGSDYNHMWKVPA